MVGSIRFVDSFQEFMEVSEDIATLEHNLDFLEDLFARVIQFEF